MRRRDTFVRRPICLQWMPGWHCPCGRCLRRSVQSNRKLWILQLSQWVEIKTVLASCKCTRCICWFQFISHWILREKHLLRRHRCKIFFVAMNTLLLGEKLSQKMSNMIRGGNWSLESVATGSALTLMHQRQMLSVSCCAIALHYTAPPHCTMARLEHLPQLFKLESGWRFAVSSQGIALWAPLRTNCSLYSSLFIICNPLWRLH